MLKIRDIANHVGVSSTTVSYVLSDGPRAARISQETRLKILNAAEELGYRSNHFARAMRTGHTKMVGVLGGQTEEEHVGQMLKGALDAADAHGYTLKLLRLHAVGNSAQQAIRRSSELRLAGILALHLPEEVLDALHAEAKKCGTPLVLMDTYCRNPEMYQVISDDAQGFAQGVGHLVELGHSKISLIKGGGETAIGVLRQEAFELALSHHGITLAENYCQEGSFHIREQSEEAARSLLSLPAYERPTAIFCASDLMALATLRVARELHLNVPCELSIIGFSNGKATEYVSPALTTIEQSFPDMGSAAVEMLLKLSGQRGQIPLEEESLSSTLQIPMSHTRDNAHFLKTRLIIRESTAPPKLKR